MDGSKRYVAYYRVSTQMQFTSGYSIESQRDAVLSYMRANQGLICGEFTEAHSGADNWRPEIAKALALTRLYSATLVVARLDRLARNLYFVSSLMEAGVDFVAIDMPLINRFTIHIVAAVAQNERTISSDRCRLGIRRAIESGKKWGFSSRSKEALEATWAKSIAACRTKSARNARAAYPEILRARSEGAATLREVADRLNERAVPTHTGLGKWYSSTVRNVERRISRMQVHDNEPGPVLYRFPAFPRGIASGAYLRRASFAFAKKLDALLSILRADGFKSRIDIVNELNRRQILTFSGRPWRMSRFANVLTRLKQLKSQGSIMPLRPAS
jgi:DNA invertase Pin-like site-specific DNA recombinase